jgi:hypothetical protein
MLRCLSPALLLALAVRMHATEPMPDLRSIPADLSVPPLSAGTPAAGQRTRLGLNVLYLPTDWQMTHRLPLLIELPGNGGYTNAAGDTCTGKPEDSCMGYGLSGGRGFIWLCVPFLAADGSSLALKWWGDAPDYDPQPTLRHLRASVKEMCEHFGADAQRVILCGFSRGAIAANYIGLHDAETASLWRGFLLCSHYDGVKKWPFPHSDGESALRRLQRLGTRPQFICGESENTDETAAYLRPLLPQADITFTSTGFRNHSDAWTLRPSPARDLAREWLMRVTK